jgi:hypothetical protein
VLVDLLFLFFISVLASLLSYTLFDIELKGVLSFLPRSSLVGFVKTFSVVLGSVSRLAILDLLVELEVALSLFILPQVREALVINAQLKSITVLDDI